MGVKTSVYLPDDLAAALKASGRSLGEVIRAGLGMKTEPPEDILRRVIREELAALPPGAALPADTP